MGRHHLRDGEAAPHATDPAVQAALSREESGVPGYTGQLPVHAAGACGVVGEEGGGASALGLRIGQ